MKPLGLMTTEDGAGIDFRQLRLQRRARAVSEMEQIHLMGTTWDDGIPREIPTDNLSGLMWNPRLTVEALARIDGLSRATTIGVDGMSPGMAQLFGTLAPNGEIVDGEQLMRGVRAAKLPAESD